MLTTYYVEVNIVAIWIAAILLRQNNKQTSREETSNIIFHGLLGLLILMCTSDIVALTCDGKTWLGARIIVYLANGFYFFFQAAVVYFWMLFFLIRLKYVETLRSKFTAITAIPFIVFLILFITNPYSNIFYYVDANSVYHRGSMVYLHWLEEAIYIIWTFFLICMQIVRNKVKHVRREYCSYILFYIPLLVGYLCQMLFFGVSSTQIGLIISLLMVYLSVQDNQIIRDDLTGLNNRRSLYNHEMALVSHENGHSVTLFMIDVDKFKSINDTYGHLKGDEALQQIATVLRTALGDMPGNRLVIYRYAGDEFVVVGTNMNEANIQMAKERIQHELDTVNSTNKNPYHLGLSVGVASAICKTTEEFDALLSKADSNMYDVKMSKRKSEQITDDISSKNKKVIKK